MGKKSILLFLFVLLLAGALWYFFGREEKLASEIAAELTIAEASVEGLVLSRTGDTLMIQAARVERGEEGNRVAMYERRVTLMPEAAGGSNLKAGDRAVFYGTDEEPFKAYRVEVLSRASEVPPLPAGAPPLQ